TQFEDLQSRVGRRIGLRDTNYRRCIPAAERLSICLRTRSRTVFLRCAWTVEHCVHI
ncbi:hypothetical protein CHARACLAT_022174, partial [Characodon lateralis]|nr:hypothetical protein [Characodon lateralis]